MKIGRLIYSAIAADASLTALIGSRVYPTFLPQNAAYPAIVYTVNNASLDQTKGHPGFYDVAQVEFNIWADAAQGQNAYDSLDNIDYALRALFDNYSGTAGGVTASDGKYGGSIDGRDEDRTLFLRQARYQFITVNQ